MEPYLLCVMFWALLYVLARFLGEDDIAEATHDTQDRFSDLNI